MKKTTMVAVMASLMAMVATTFGTVVEKKLDIDQRVSFQPETQKVVLFLDLPAGDWNINANLNLFAYGELGTMVYYASFLSLGTPFIDFHDGRVTFGDQILHPDPLQRYPGRMDEPVALVGRRITVVTPPGTTQRVYLLIWVHTSDGLGTGIINAAAYGFAYAKTQ